VKIGLFGFITKAGSYQADKFEQDKRYLENYYKTLGYISAKVANAKVSLESKNQAVHRHVYNQ